jgi:hypothetical protein
MVGQRGKIEVVSRSVSLEYQHSFDSQDFGAGWYPDLAVFYRQGGGFEWGRSDELANTGLDSIQASENENRPVNPGGLPTCYRFKLRQYFVEVSV